MCSNPLLELKEKRKRKIKIYLLVANKNDISYNKLQDYITGKKKRGI